MNIFAYVEKHKILSSILVLWTYGLMTWVVYRVFDDVTLINGAVNGALTVVVGIPAVAIGLFKWRRGGSSNVGGND